jgi:hypothetical protein
MNATITVPLGMLVATPNALANVSSEEIQKALQRHVSGDWGELDEEDKKANDEALQSGERLLSAYKSATGTKFWIITEADRSVTTILLPEDY